MTSTGAVGHQLLGEGHDVAVVGVGLVELEHRELGVVAGREALVAEHPADLEDPLEAADDQALQVELGRDPQEQLLVERVVVGGEGLGQCPAGDRVEDRGLDLDEVPVLQPATTQGHDLGAGQQRGPGLGGDPGVHVPLPVPGVGVGEAVPLVRERPHRTGQDLPVGHLHRQLALAGLDHLAGRPHPGAEGQGDELGVVSRRLLQGEQLDVAGEVPQDGEGQAAVGPLEHEPAGDGHHDPGLLAVGDDPVGLDDLGGVMGGLDPVRDPGRIGHAAITRRSCRRRAGARAG